MSSTCRRWCAKLFAKDVANPSTWTNANINIAGSLGSVFANNWTLEFMVYKDATNSATFSQTQQTLISIGDATDSTGGCGCIMICLKTGIASN